jgi:hypothetical protein
METNAKNLPKNFTPDTVMKGNQGEQIVAALLRKEGYFVTCLSDINEQGKNGAPGMRSDNEYLILPDLQVALNGRLGYCEVKWKTKPDWTVITNQNEHGIDKHCWDHYQMVRIKTGADVFLFIYERKSGLVLYNHIDFLDSIKRFAPNWGKVDRMGNRKGGFFFPWLSFHKWGIVIPVNEEIYIQATMFSPKIEGQGDRLFGYDIPDMRLKR